MNKKYCKCGHINEYSYSIPKFCSGCGQSFGAKIVKASRPSTPARSNPVNDIIYDEPEYEESTQDFRSMMDGLAVEVEAGDNENVRYKMGDLISQQKIGIQRGKPFSSEEDILKTTREICKKERIDIDE